MSVSALDAWTRVIQEMGRNARSMEALQKERLRGLLTQYQRQVRDRRGMPDATLLGQYAHHLQQSMNGLSPLSAEWSAFAETDRKEILRRMSGSSATAFPQQPPEKRLEQSPRNRNASTRPARRGRTQRPAARSR